jgi:hypothetical protein
MSDPPDDLYVFTETGLARLCNRNAWQDLFVSIKRNGWCAPSSERVGWLYSPLVPQDLGSFFTAEDAESFAKEIDGYLENEGRTLALEFAYSIKQVQELFRSGAVLVRPVLSSAPKSGATEFLYVYACGKCGFMGQGTLSYDNREYELEQARLSAQSLLQHIYCPLCGSRDTLSAIFPLIERTLEEDNS